MNTPRRVLRFRRAVHLATTFAVLAGSAWSQSDLENVLKQYDETTVEGYVKPLADVFGANMNGGLYNSASIPEGFSISLELIGMASSVSDDQKTYTVNLPAGYPSSTASMPTIFGGKSAPVTGPGGLSTGGSGGIFDASFFPNPMVQARGGIYGTEAILRFVPVPAVGDALPKTTLFGIGLRHSVSRYFPDIPLDIAGGFFYSKVTSGDIIDFTGLSIGAQAGKRFSVVRLYGGLAWEQSTMHLQYTQSAGSAPVDVELDGENSFRFTLGGGLSFGLFGVFADANFGAITNFTGGIGVTF
jgi:hypothetical protein